MSTDRHDIRDPAQVQAWVNSMSFKLPPSPKRKYGFGQTFRSGEGSCPRKDICTQQCALWGFTSHAEHKFRYGASDHLTAMYLDPVMDRLEEQKRAAPYMYEPMDDKSVRILELCPGKFEDILVANIYVASLARDGGVTLLHDGSRIMYEALSYHWGTPVFSRMIKCNGWSYSLTHTLHQALQRLRLLDRPRYLWVDQLCINQHDLQERSSQVQKMLSIYESAFGVVVWLGAEHKCTEYVAKARGLGILHSQTAQTHGPLSAASDHLCYPHFHRFKQGLEDLFARQWYKRLWIKQEVWGAKQVLMVCGPFQCGWDELEYYCKCFHQLGGHTTEQQYRESSPFQAVQQEKENTSRDLLAVLARSSSSECSDTRDFVYGVVGISQVAHGTNHPGETSSTPSNFSIDYTKTAAEVYQDVMKYYVSVEGSLGVFVRLSQSYRRNSKECIFGGQVDGWDLPSWCPNWSIPWVFETPRDWWNEIGYERDWYNETGDDDGFNSKYYEEWYTLFKLEHAREREKGLSERESFAKSSFSCNTLNLIGMELGQVGQVRNVGASWTFDLHLDKAKTPWRKSWWPRKKLILTVLRGSRLNQNDIIVVVHGCLTPWILRPTEHGGIFEFVGIAMHIKHGLYEGYGTDSVFDQLLRYNEASLREFRIQ